MVSGVVVSGVVVSGVTNQWCGQWCDHAVSGVVVSGVVVGIPVRAYQHSAITGATCTRTQKWSNEVQV